jgi:RNA polymerase sigma-32 factor
VRVVRAAKSREPGNQAGNQASSKEDHELPKNLPARYTLAAQMPARRRSTPSGARKSAVAKPTEAEGAELDLEPDVGADPAADPTAHLSAELGSLSASGQAADSELAPSDVAPEVLAALAGAEEEDLGDDGFELPAPVIDVAIAGAGRAAGADASLAGFSALGVYLQELRRHSLLTREEEHALAVRFSKTGDSAAARRLITSNLRLVVKISQEYRRAHKNLLDLIQEGNIGLIQAVQKYDPFRGVKLSSYAAWWIRAYILKFILANWRIVKIGTTQAQRKLFFNLRKEREKLEKAGFEVEAKHLAAALDVTEREVIEMERRLGSSETSIDSPVRGDESGGRTQGDFLPAAQHMRPDVQVEAGEFQELLRAKLESFGATLKDRELDIFRERLLNDSPSTLQEIGEKYGVSRERARQIEERLKKRLRIYLQSHLGDAVQINNRAE